MDTPDRRLLRLVLGVVAGLVVLGTGLVLLGLAVLARPGGGVSVADPMIRSGVLVAGWLLLALGPVLGLRITGLPWRRAAWALPAAPLLAVIVSLGS